MEAVLSDKECGYYMKLITFILEIGMDVLHTYFEQNILNAKEHLEFYMFLDKNKHNLYHECYPKVECCECSQNGLGMASQKGCLTKQQFLLLFEIGALTETDHYETGRRINEISKQCLCRIIAKRSNDVDCMDITLMYAIIQSCYLKHNIAIHGNPRCIEAIKDTRNFLAHLPNPRISKSEYDTRFAETEKAILEIGSSLGNYFAKRNQKKIDEFKRNDLSIEGIKKIIENNIDEIIKKKLQSLMKDQIKSTMMEFKEEWKIEVQNLTFQVLKDAMASCSIEKTSDSSGPQKNATACGVNVEETEEGNINVKKRRVEWKLLTPSTWNLPDIIDTLKKRSARLRQWFEIENVFEGSLVIQTLVQQNVLDNREQFRASVHLFLEKFVEVCRINADVPTVIEVALIIELGEFEKEETEEQPSNIEMKKKDETTCIAYNIDCQKCRQKDEIIASLKEELYEMDKDSPEIKSLKSVSDNIGVDTGANKAQGATGHVLSSSAANYARLVIAVKHTTPNMLKDLLELLIPSSSFNFGLIPQQWMTRLNPEELKKMRNAKNKGYSDFDIPLIYKILRIYHLCLPPTRGWDHPTDPLIHEISIGDDIERCRRLYNVIVHRPNPMISSQEYNDFLSDFKSIARRFEIYLNKQPNEFVSQF